MDFLDYKDNEEFFAYFDIQNLSIDHSLTSKEIEEYKDLIFSPNGLKQIYFKDKCDLKTVLLIKNLLTISDYVDNFQVEKYVLLDLNKEDYNTLLNESFEYPITWKLPCEFENDNIVLLDIPKIRFIDTFVSKFDDPELSCAEKIMKVYDTIKLFDYEEDSDERYYSIIKNKKANSKGMNKLFSYTLNKLGYKSFVGTLKGDNEESFVTLVEVIDKKYKINGIYLFDPSMDTLSKDKYLKEDVRKINYNFFGLNIMTMNRLKYKDSLFGILSILSLEDIDYAQEKLDICQDKHIIRENQKITNIFKQSFSDLYNKLKNSKQIGVEKIVRINDSLYPEKKEKYNDYLIENYNSRKDELFDKNTEEELEDFIEIIKK